MHKKLWTSGLLSLSLSLACVQSAISNQSIFSNDSFSSAKEIAKKNNKYLVIDFTATWCGPCKMMDATTFVDASVKKWIAENAVAVQLDVDKHRDIATTFGVNAFPTILVFTPKDLEHPFDRVSGYRDGHDFIDWLSNVKLGKSSEDLVRQDLKKVEGKDGRAEVRTRYKLTRALVNSGKYDEAADNYVWLWENIPKLDPSLVGVRGSYMVSEMKMLCQKFPEAKKRFDKLRLEAEKKNRADWISLNDALGENGKTLSWFDSIKNDPSQAAVIDGVDFLLEPILVDQHRWADIGNFLYKDPIKKLQRQYQFSESLKADYRSKNFSEVDPFPKAISIEYAALLAAGKDADAKKVAEESMRVKDSIELRFGLFESAHRINQPRPEQLKWLQDIKSHTEAGSIEIDRARAQFLIDLDQYTDALPDLNRIIESKPTLLPALVLRGFAYYKTHNYKLALADFDRAIAVSPKDPLIWVNKSAVYLKEKNFVEAEKCASHALELDPKNSGALCDRGEASFNLQHYEKAIPDLTKAIASESKRTRVEAAYYRALAYDKTGKADLAAQDRKLVEKLGGYKPESDD